MHEWDLTADQKNAHIISTETYRRALKAALAHGLSQQAAANAAHDASRDALNRSVPNWERGDEGFLGFAGLFV